MRRLVDCAIPHAGRSGRRLAAVRALAARGSFRTGSLCGCIDVEPLSSSPIFAVFDVPHLIRSLVARAWPGFAAGPARPVVVLIAKIVSTWARLRVMRLDSLRRDHSAPPIAARTRRAYSTIAAPSIRSMAAISSSGICFAAAIDCTPSASH